VDLPISAKTVFKRSCNYAEIF